MKVLKDFDNKLCNRKEYVIEIGHEKAKSPTKEETKKKIAELTKSKEALVSVKGIYTKYGYSKSKINAYIYNNPESFKRFEIKNKKDGKKNKRKKEAKK